jgi:hypothetical protein
MSTTSYLGLCTVLLPKPPPPFSSKPHTHAHSLFPCAATHPRPSAETRLFLQRCSSVCGRLLARLAPHLNVGKLAIERVLYHAIARSTELKQVKWVVCRGLYGCRFYWAAIDCRCHCSSSVGARPCASRQTRAACRRMLPPTVSDSTAHPPAPAPHLPLPRTHHPLHSTRTRCASQRCSCPAWAARAVGPSRPTLRRIGPRKAPTPCPRPPRPQTTTVSVCVCTCVRA